MLELFRQNLGVKIQQPPKAAVPGHFEPLFSGQLVFVRLAQNLFQRIPGWGGVAEGATAQLGGAGWK